MTPPIDASSIAEQAMIYKAAFVYSLLWRETALRFDRGFFTKLKLQYKSVRLFPVFPFRKQVQTLHGQRQSAVYLNSFTLGNRFPFYNKNPDEVVTQFIRISSRFLLCYVPFKC